MLLRGREGGDRQAKSRKSDQIYGGEQIDHPETPLRHQAVDQPSDKDRHRQQDKAYHPERDQLRQQEQGLGYGRDVYLLDRPFLLLAHDIQGGDRSPDNRQQEYHDAGNHIDLVTQVGIEQVNRSHSPARSHRGETFLPIEILYNRGEVGATQAALSSVHGVSGDHHVRPALLPQVPLEIRGDFQNDIGLIALHRGQRLVVTIRPVCQAEISGG